jgi:hypothetical protein
MKRIIVTLACLVLVVGYYFLPVATGSAHAQSSNTICASSGTGLCFDTQVLNPVNGDILKNKTYSGSTEQAFVLQVDDECSSTGTVTSSCPFSDSTLDSQEINDQVFKIVPFEEIGGNTCVATLSLEPVFEGCSNNGTVFVSDVSGSPENFANVFVSDHYSTLYDLCSSGTNNTQALIEAHAAGVCDLGTHS